MIIIIQQSLKFSVGHKSHASNTIYHTQNKNLFISSNKHNLSIGLSKTLVLVFTKGRLTRPFASETAFSTFPITHELLGAPFVHYKNNISFLQIFPDSSPLLPLLRKAQVLPGPAFSEDVRQVLYLFPPLPGIQVLFLKHSRRQEARLVVCSEEVNG